MFGVRERRDDLGPSLEGGGLHGTNRVNSLGPGAEMQPENRYL